MPTPLPDHKDCPYEAKNWKYLPEKRKTEPHQERDVIGQLIYKTDRLVHTIIDRAAKPEHCAVDIKMVDFKYFHRLVDDSSAATNKNCQIYRRGPDSKIISKIVFFINIHFLSYLK